MEQQEKTSSIRLPKVQEDYIKLMNEQYGFTRNNLIKMALLLHQNQHQSLLRNDINLPSEMISNRDKKDIAKCNQTATRNDIKPPSPSRAPSILHSKYKNIYNIIDNKIIFIREDVQKAWNEFLKYRKEMKRPITKTGEPFQARFIDRVLANETETDLIRRLHDAISKGWLGFIFDNETTDEKKQFSEDDL